MTAQGISQLDRAWAVLTTPSNDKLASYPMDLACGELYCRVALDRNGFRHLLIPTSDERPDLDTRPAVLSAVIRPLDFHGAIDSYLDVACLDKDLHPEFDEVILDILETISEADFPACAAAESLARWRRLFRSRLVRGLSMESKMGLYAELSVLNALVGVDSALAVDVWRGPLREPHDFELDSRCIEVKGLAERSDSITVHGWDQLDRHDERDLELVLLTVIPDPDGTTISELVRKLREKVQSPAALKTRLLAAGWDEQSAAEADSFTIGAVYGIPVSDTVPRLVKGMLVQGTQPDGVSNVRYQVDLAPLLPLASATSLHAIAEEALR